MSLFTRAREALNTFFGSVFLVIWYLFLASLAWLLARSAIGHYHYLLADEPTLIQRMEEALKLEEDEPFLIRLPLDWKHGIQIESLSRAYTLVPVAGSGGRLIVARNGHAQKAEKSTMQTLIGRVMGRDLFGDWDAGELDASVNLQSEFRRIGMDIPEDALLLVVDWDFGFDEYWQMTLGTVVLVIVLVAGLWVTAMAVVVLR